MLSLRLSSTDFAPPAQSGSAAPLDEQASRLNTICLAVAFLIGAVLRLIPLLQSSWVVGDGGLFWSATQAIVSHHFVLPGTIFYPTLDPQIPFCYPPLAFYLAAIPYSMGVPLELVFKWLPFGFSLLLLFFVWQFANTLFRGSFAAGAATLLWSASFLGFSWHIQGGGLPRGLGMCFALAAMNAALRLWRDREARGFWMAALLLALALVTHLERAQMGVIGVLVLWLCYGRSWRSAAQLGGIFLLALAFSSPWWGVCVARFGMAPFLSASRATQYLPLTPFHFFPVLIALLCLRKRIVFAALWALFIVVFEPRSSFIFLTVPISLSLGAVVETCFLASWPPRVSTGVRGTLLVFLLVCFGVNSFGQLPTINSLTSGHRDAMLWVAQRTPKNSSFLVLPTQAWARDIVSEWFPSLTLRPSIMTVQGAEWLGSGVFSRREAQQTRLMECTSWHEVEVWSQDNHLEYKWVFVPRRAYTNVFGFDEHLRRWNEDLERHPQWKRVYANEDVVIFHRVK